MMQNHLLMREMHYNNGNNYFQPELIKIGLLISRDSSMKLNTLTKGIRVPIMPPHMSVLKYPLKYTVD